MKKTKKITENQGIYVVYDILAEEYGPIYQAKNDAVALRNYYGLFERNSLFQKEFKLYRIARLDTFNMSIMSHDPVEVLVSDEKDLNDE